MVFGSPDARYGPGGQLVQALLDDVAGLFDALDQHPETVVRIAPVPDRHLELHLAVLLVRLVLAGVHGHAGGLSVGPEHPYCERDRAMDARPRRGSGRR